MGNRAITDALTQLWPRDRFAPEFDSFWLHEFSGFDPASVVDAIRALKHRRDPYAPTTEAVREILAEWSIVPTHGQVGRSRQVRAATPAENELMRDRFRRPPPEDEVAQTICDTLDDETFARLAAEALATIHPDARATVERRPLRDSIFVKRLVADRVRKQTEVAA